MAITAFTTDDAFPMAQVNIHDRRFMSRIDRNAWDAQVKALMVEIEQHGQMNPVGIARTAGEHGDVVVYGFTRTEAVYRLGRSTIRANVYEDLDETTARLLNAGDNAWHTQLTEWERALQLRKLREIGIPVESASGGPCLTQLFGMSRRTVFNWLRIVEYDAPVLHQALANKTIGLQQALVFRDFPRGITEDWIDRCVREEWSSAELKSRLSASSRAHNGDHGGSNPSGPMGATLHARMSSEPIPIRATLHEGDEVIDRNLAQAGQWLLRASSAQIEQLSQPEQEKLKTGLRMVLEVIASMAPRHR